jgi:integrase
MKIRFYLRKTTQNYCIYFEFRNSAGTIRLRTSTGFYLVNKKDWDSKHQRIKIPSAVFGAVQINSKLIDGMYKFNKSMDGINENDCSESLIKKLMLSAFDKLSVEEKRKEQEFKSKHNLIDYYVWYLDYYSKHNSPFTKKALSPASLKTYKTGLSRLKEYIAARKLKSFSFNDCNREFYDDYIDFLTKRNYSNNYIGTIIQKLKTILGFAFDEGVHKNIEFKKSYFAKLKEEIDHIYLNKAELDRILELQLNDEKLDCVRDIFIICCYTGLRISDMSRLLRKDTQVIFEEDGVLYFNLRQAKTSKPVIIPLNSTVKKIIEKYEGNLPNYIHQNTINIHIKSICKRAKINDDYTFTRTVGGKLIEITQPKYKLVSCHTARRTFCTNAYKASIPIQDIMSVSGHKSERVFLSYVKVDKIENAKRIAKYDFFN